MSDNFSERHWSIKMQCSFPSDSSEARAGGEATSKLLPIDTNPSTQCKISTAKMLTPWALVIMLAVYAGALDLLTPPSLLGNLPHDAYVPGLSNNVPINVLVQGLPKYPSIPKRFSSTRHSVGTSGDRCPPVAKYFMSSSKLNEYLNATLPPQIEKMLMCAELDLAGVLGEVLSTVSSSDLLSVIDITSSLNILGGAGLGGVLGKGSSGKSPNLPLPPLSGVTGAVGDLVPMGQQALGSLLSLGAEKNPVKGLINGIGLTNLQTAVGDVVNGVDKLKEPAQRVLNSAVPAGANNALMGLLGNVNVEDLLLGLEVQKATVESMTSTMTGDGILVDATTTAFINGKGLAGPVVGLLGLQVHSDMTLKIGISTTTTQCIDLQVQEKDIKVKKVTLQIVESITESLPVPVPVPLDDIIPQVLTVKMNENIKESKSCDIDLSDFNECKNSTGLFKYQVKSYGISAEGLSIFYCAEAFFNKNPVPVPGSPLPPDPKNANISLSLSHTILRAIIAQSAKRSSVKVNNLDASISKISYSFWPDNKIQVIYWVPVKTNGESFVTGKTNLIISHACKISKDKLTADIKIVSTQHSVTLPEAVVEVQDVMPAVLNKFFSAIMENLSQWNVPPGVTSNPLINAKVEMLKSNNLQAAN